MEPTVTDCKTCRVHAHREWRKILWTFDAAPKFSGTPAATTLDKIQKTPEAFGNVRNQKKVDNKS